ncbi:restriction endonuclease subunit S [Phaeodactylibacter xiamenensis]|uniref:restriction endonuclease subunit S n=1 Tax=Phaeodactylibacter xiamenensis TaxID=1524460 RepID=UPI003CCB7D98
MEPASELLARIEAEKAELVKAKKIRKEKPLAEIEKSERWSSIPKTWLFVRLGEIGDWGSGATPKRSESKFYGGSINWFKSGELNNYIIDYESKEKITDLAVQKTSVRLNQPGDVLIAMYGATIGKTGVLAVHGTTNQAVCACTCFSGMNNRFLHLLLKALKPIFIGQGEGGAQPNISRIKIRNQPIPLPPLPEQQAIVQTVDALLQELDQLQQRTETRLQLKTDYATAALRRLTTAPAVGPAWEALAPHFRTFFDETGNVQSLSAAILQLAVQGKLTAQWRKAHPDVEPATELLSRIKAEKAALVKAKKIKKEKPLPPVDAAEVPFAVPEGWVWCRLGEVITFLNGFAFKSSTYVADSEYQIIRLGNVKNDGLKLDIKQAYVPKEIGESTLAYQILENDILTTLTGTKGKKDYCYTCIVEAENVENKTLLLNQRVGCIRAVERSFPPLLNIFLKSESLLDQLFATESGTANQGNIGSGSFKQLIFPLPPLPEQHAIVQAVEELLGLCTALEEAAGRRDVVLGDWVRAVVAGG